MSFRHFLRVIQARWWAVVAVGLLAAAVAVGAAQTRNVGLESRFEAVAPVSVLRLPEEKDDSFNRRLSSVEAQARSVLAAEMAADPSLGVEADTALGAIRFVATAPTSEEALASAVGLRAVYVSARPAETAEEQLLPVLDALAQEIALVETSLASLQGEQADPVVEARRAALRTELDRTAQQAVALSAQLLDPNLTDAERFALEEQLAAADDLLRSIGSELASLPTGSIDGTRARLETLVLQRRLRDLESQYVGAALRRAEVGAEGLVGQPFVVDRSARPISPLLAALVGLAAGSLLGLGGVLVADRVNEPLRSEGDVPGLPMLAVARRSRRSRAGFAWYAGAAGDVRRTQVQGLRTRVDRGMPQGGVLAVAGVGATPRDVQQLAVDLAASVAATGRPVLTVDTDLSGSSADAGDGAPTLAEMLSVHDGPNPDRSAIKRMLWDRSEVLQNLMVVLPGSIPSDPVDALAGSGFVAVVEEARELADLVVLVTPDAAAPAADPVAGRSDHAVLVAEAGSTQRRDLADVLGDLTALGVDAAGVALIVARRGRGRTRRRRSRRARHSHRKANS